MHTQTKKILSSTSSRNSATEFAGVGRRAEITSTDLALCLIEGIARESAVNLGREVVRNNRARRIERQIKRLGIWRD
jgi:hypothetical protein